MEEEATTRPNEAEPLVEGSDVGARLEEDEPAPSEAKSEEVETVVDEVAVAAAVDVVPAVEEISSSTCK